LQFLLKIPCFFSQANQQNRRGNFCSPSLPCAPSFHAAKRPIFLLLLHKNRSQFSTSAQICKNSEFFRFFQNSHQCFSSFYPFSSMSYFFVQIFKFLLFFKKTSPLRKKKRSRREPTALGSSFRFSSHSKKLTARTHSRFLPLLPFRSDPTSSA